MDVLELYKDIKIKENDYIVFGCSYGPDSMALFRSLLELRRHININLVCCHVNHSKRKESLQEQIDLENYCKKYDVIFEYMKIEKYGDDNFHNEARNIRYNFFDSVVSKYNAKYLMMAHHGDDLMETILMRIVRGSTLIGYSGFQKLVRRGDYYVFRPFIGMTKKELEEFDARFHIPYAIDASNFSDVYTRNRYRKVVLPFLKKEDINVHKKFLKFSNTLYEANMFIEKEVNKYFGLIVNDNELNIKSFLEIDPFLQKIILEKFISSFYQDDLMLINDRHVKLLQKLIKSKRSNATIFLPNDVKVVKAYDYLTIKRDPDLVSSYEIEVMKEVILPNNHKLLMVDEVKSNSNNIIKLSSKEVSLPLIVRTRRVGDVISLKGSGHKKIKDIFIEKKIPLAKRDLWPIVTDSKGVILFVPGLKKSKFDKTNNDFYDIILRYE